MNKFNQSAGRSIMPPSSTVDIGLKHLNVAPHFNVGYSMIYVRVCLGGGARKSYSVCNG
jgi:hypothetical protein